MTQKMTFPQIKYVQPDDPKSGTFETIGEDEQRREVIVYCTDPDHYNQIVKTIR